MFRARAISTCYARGVVRRRAVSAPCGAAAGISKSHVYCQESTVSLWPEPLGLTSRARQQSTGVMTPRVNPRCLHSETVVEGNSETRAGHEFDGDRVPPQDEERIADLIWKLQDLGRSNDPGRGEEASCLLQEGRRSGVKYLRVYNAALRSLSGTVNSSTIEETLAQIREDGLQPDVHTYNFVIYGFAFNKDEERAVRAYEKMIEEGVAPDNRTLSNLIVAHSWGDNEKMRRVLQEMKEKKWWPTRGAYHSMIPAMRRTEDLRGIYEAMHDMKKEGRAPNDPSFAIGFWAARKLRDPDFAKMLLEMRSKAEYPPRQDFFVQVMLALRDADRHDELLAYWRQLVCVNGLGDLEIAQETFVLALRSAARVRAWDEMEVILGMMQARDVTLPGEGEVYAALLVGQRPGERSAVNVDDVERMAKLVEDVEQRTGVTPGPPARLRLAVLWARAKEYDKAMPLFEEAMPNVLRVAPETRELLVLTLVRLERYAEVKEAWLATTEKDKANFRGQIYQNFMRAAERLGDVDWAVEILESRAARGRSTHGWFHAVPVKMLADAERLEEAGDMMRTFRDKQYPKMPQEAYDVLCRCSKEKGNTKLAVEIVKDMRRGATPLFPSPVVLEFVIRAFLDQGRARDAIELFEQLCAQNRQPDSQCYVLMADAAVEGKDRKRAYKYVAEVEKRGLKASPAALVYAEGEADDCAAASH